MKRLYLVDKQVQELASCVRARICVLSRDLAHIKGIENQELLCDRINLLSDILEILNDDEV